MTKVAFPSTEYFRALQAGLVDPAATEGIAPSEAYCGLRIDSSLFVLEFDGHECAAVVSGGNPIDLDFVLGGSLDAWERAVGASPEGARKLDELLSDGGLVIETEADDGEAMARAALPMLQAFLDQARGVEADVR
jgi:hypothetical protein